MDISEYIFIFVNTYVYRHIKYLAQTIIIRLKNAIYKLILSPVLPMSTFPLYSLCMYVCTCIYVVIYASLCMYAGMYVCAYLYMWYVYICTQVCIYVCIYTCVPELPKTYTSREIYYVILVHTKYKFIPKYIYEHIQLYI
jgi:hypothetical protein